MIMKPLPSVCALFSPSNVSCSHGKALLNEVLCRDISEANVIYYNPENLEEFGFVHSSWNADSLVYSSFCVL